MTPPSDPFASEVDSIEIDPATAHAPEASDNTLAPAAPAAAVSETEQPGFYLLSDADGRFVVDREIGVISLTDDALIEAERDAVYTARLRVIEPSGASYELDMPLRITGHVPQLVGGEGFAFTPIPPRSVRAAAPPAVPWWTFAAVSGVGAPAAIGCDADAPYGAVLQANLPVTEIDFIPLILAEAPPPPAPPHAAWAI